MDKDRTLLREGPINEVNANGEVLEERKYMYLFSDYIVIGQVMEGNVRVEKMIEIKEISISDEADTKSCENSFSIKQGKNRFVLLSCMTYEEKKSWMNDFNRAINTMTTDQQLAIAFDNKQFSKKELQEICIAMNKMGTGVTRKNKKKGFKTFSNCFTGSDAIDWLVRNYNLKRKAALELGKHLEAEHFIHHVEYAHPFEDKSQLYEFQELGPGSDRMPNFLEQDLVKQIFRSASSVKTSEVKKTLWGKKRKVFNGHDATSWLAQHFNIQRNIAVAIGNQLLQHEHFHAVTLPLFGDDKNLLYEVNSSLDDLGFPTERVLRALKELRSNPQFNSNPKQVSELDEVIKTLSSGGNL